MIDYNIIGISKVKIDQLSEFYKQVFKSRYKTLTSNWKWWYRYGYSKYEPLIILSDGKVIGQAGIQPVDLKIKNEKFLAVWFLDFAILPEFRKKGLGKILPALLIDT